MVPAPHHFMYCKRQKAVQGAGKKDAGRLWGPISLASQTFSVPQHHLLLVQIGTPERKGSGLWDQGVIPIKYTVQEQGSDRKLWSMRDFSLVSEIQFTVCRSKHKNGFLAWFLYFDSSCWILGYSGSFICVVCAPDSEVQCTLDVFSFSGCMPQ